jgi:FG-GAP-like repeat
MEKLSKTAAGLCGALVLCCCSAPVESAEFAASYEELSYGMNDLNEPIRNATVLFGNGCSGTLIRNDIVLGCGHCGVLASAWNTPGVSQQLANDWRSLGDWLQQTVTVTFDRFAPVCAAADDPATCAFRTHVIASSEGGSVDQLLFLLDRPVPSKHAIPSTVMSKAKYDAIGGLSGRAVRPAGWGLLADDTSPRYRQTIPIGTASFLSAIDSSDPNKIFVTHPSRVSTLGGDSGGGLYWWDPGEQRQYVVADLQSTGNTSVYFATFQDIPGVWLGTDGVADTPDDIPAANISTWIQDRLNDPRRMRFSPEAPDRWLAGFCSKSDVCSTGDFDGDGDADVVRMTRNGVGVAPGTVNIGFSRRFRSWMPEHNDSGFGLQRWATGVAVSGESVKIGDVNGDGKDDIVEFERTGSHRIRAWLSLVVPSSTGYGPPSATSFSPATPRTADPWCQSDSTFCAFANIMGGSGEDLVEINPSSGNVRVLAATGSGLSPVLSHAPTFSLSSACPSSSCRPLIGDVDGDHLDDLVFIPRSGTTVTWARNMGASWATVSMLTDTGICSGTARCKLGDVDGDSRDDLVAFGTDGLIRVRRRILSAVIQSAWHSSSLCANALGSCEVADVNGDSIEDVVAIGADGDNAAPVGDVSVAISLAPRPSFFINPRTGAP